MGLLRQLWGRCRFDILLKPDVDLTTRTPKVIVNALALYWATYPRTKRQRIVTANSALGSKDLGPTRTGGLSLAARASTPFIIPPQAIRSRGELQRQDTNDPYTNPFALPRYIPKNPEPEVRITAESQTSTGKASQGIWAFVSRLLPRRPTAAGEEGQRRALEVGFCCSPANSF